MTSKRTMSLNLSDDEMNSLDEVAARYDMSKTAIIRKALRMYLVIDGRMQNGERVFMEDELLKKKSELVLL